MYDYSSYEGFKEPVKLTLENLNDYYIYYVDGDALPTFVVDSNGIGHIVSYVDADAVTALLGGVLITGNDLDEYGIHAEGHMEIPQYVKYKGVTLPVIGIGDQAFVKNTKLTYVKIPKTVKMVGASAFHGCINAEINIPDTLDYISAYAFKDVKQVYRYSTQSPLVEVVKKERELDKQADEIFGDLFDF